MKKIAVLSRQEEKLTACLSGVQGYAIQYSESPEILPDTACVLISQESAGASMREKAQQFRRKNIPFAAVTFDPSDENQVYLLDCGYLHILTMPMSAGLLQKHIDALAGTAEQHDSGGTNFDFFFTQMTDTDNQRGAYIVQESDFANIFRYVQRLQERMDKQSHLVRFSFHTRLNIPPEPGVLEDAFPIVLKCLRRGDIVSIFGDSIVAILIGADEEGGRKAAERIVNTYNAHCCDSVYDMRYEMNEIK